MSLILRIKYFVNDFYNAFYIWQNNIYDNAAMPVKAFSGASDFINNSSPFMTVWLLNISRLIYASEILENEFSFLDVGCGKGVSTIFAKHKYNFRSVAGFDFEPQLLISANTNWQNSKISDRDISFFEADATSLKLTDRRWFLFLFNPFDAVVMKKFLENNIDTMRKTSSIMGYANCRELELIKSFNPKKIIEIPGYRCAVIYF